MSDLIEGMNRHRTVSSFSNTESTIRLEFRRLVFPGHPCEAANADGFLPPISEQLWPASLQLWPACQWRLKIRRWEPEHDSKAPTVEVPAVEIRWDAHTSRCETWEPQAP